MRHYLAGDGLGPLLVKAVSGSAGLRIAGMGLGFLVGVQLARGLGAEGYGIYGLAMSIIAMLTVPTEFGLPQLLTREVAAAQLRGEWNRIHGMLRWSTRTSLALAAVMGVSVLFWLLVSGKTGSQMGSTMLAGVAMVPIVALLSLRSAALRGAQQIVRGQLAEVVVRPGLHSLLLFVMTTLLLPISPAIAMWLGVGAAVGAWILADRMLHQVLPARAFVASPVTDGRAWWTSALPMAMTEGMRHMQSHLLIFLLGAMVAMAQVGLYRVAASTAVLIAMPVSLFNIVSMPVIARLHASGQRVQLQRMVTLVALGMTGGVVALSVPFLVAGRWLLGHVFGQEFAGGGTALSLLCFSAIVNALFGASAALLNMTGHQNRVTVASSVTLVALAVTALPLIHAYGIKGAAIANLVTVTVWNVLMWRDCRRLLGIETGAWGVLPWFSRRFS